MALLFTNRKRHLGVALLASALTLSPAMGQGFRLPDMGSSSDTLMTGAAEERLGQAFMRSVRESVEVLEDPLATRYLETLGATLTRAADGAAGAGIRFFLVDAATINAFAGPAGHIGVHTGLILAAETESELAAVLAHEIAHVTQRHLMRGFEDQQKLGIPTLALLVAAAVLGSQVSSDAGAAAMAGIQAGALQRRINFTRDNEKEADRIGIAALVGAGYDPYAMAGFFDRLSRSGRVYENGAPDYLRTHPVNADRIADSLARAGDFGARQRPDSLGFQLTRAALRERAQPRAELAVAHFRDTLREGRHRSELAERYGYALALERSRQYEAARAESARLLAAHPAQPEFVALEARLDLRQGRTDRALRDLRQALDLAPGEWPLRLLQAEALMQAGQPARALEALERVQRQRPEDPALLEPLLQAAIKSGNRAVSQRFRAEQLQAAGDTRAAIQQLEIALRQRDIAYHDAARIQARLERLREEERERKERGGREPGR